MHNSTNKKSLCVQVKIYTHVLSTAINRLYFLLLGSILINPMSEMWLLPTYSKGLLSTVRIVTSAIIEVKPDLQIKTGLGSIHHHCKTMVNYSRPFRNLRLREISAIILLLAAWQLHIDAAGSTQKSVCQNLAPSPQLKKFVDKLPIMRTIPVSPKRISIGAWKIKQVTNSCLECVFQQR